MKKQVITQLKRAKSSNIAKNIEEAAEKDFNLTAQVTVSENAPCNIRENKTYPGKEGWKEVLFLRYNDKGNVTSMDQFDRKYGALVWYYQEQGYMEIWIKTATLGGAARIWVR